MVRPFLEWNIGIPSNRQQYICDPNALSLGDTCLGSPDAGLAAFPSTLTLGLRVFPWIRGFQATAAFDIGTSGKSSFIEELAPTPEWDLWLGAGFAFDSAESQPKTVVVEKPALAASNERRIRGFVHEKDQLIGVANATVRFQGREITGLVTTSDGRFVSAGVDPGSYTLAVHADGYKDGLCMVMVAPAGAAMPGAGPYGQAAPPPGPGMTPQPAYPGSGTGPAMAPMGAPPPPTMAGPAFADVDCPLEPLPRSGLVSGRVLDADAMSPVAGASLKAVDAQGKEVGVPVDQNGAFKIDGLLPGSVTLKADAGSYMAHAQTAEVKARETSQTDILLHKRSKRGDVELAGNEIKIKRQIHFESDSAKILGDSSSLIEEIADIINQNPKDQADRDPGSYRQHGEQRTQQDAVRATRQLGQGGAGHPRRGLEPARRCGLRPGEADRAERDPAGARAQPPCAVHGARTGQGSRRSGREAREEEWGRRCETEARAAVLGRAGNDRSRREADVDSRHDTEIRPAREVAAPPRPFRDDMRFAGVRDPQPWRRRR